MLTRATRRLSSPLDMKFILDKYDCFICDCDGVLWSGSTALSGSRETLSLLQSLEKKVYYQSNNSTSSRVSYTSKFSHRLGFEISPTQVYASSYLTALYLLSQEFPPDKRVYCVGSNGIRDELDAAGISSFGYDLHDAEPYTMDSFADSFELDESVGAVVVGYCPVFNNYKLAYAMSTARRISDCLFVATNPDETFPVTVPATGERIQLPGTGTFVAAVTAAVGRDPLVVGKPSTFGIECILEDAGVEKSRCLFVGDRLNTDILSAGRAGIDSLLVESGISQEADLEHLEDEMMRPTYIMEGFGDLLRAEGAE